MNDTTLCDCGLGKNCPFDQQLGDVEARLRSVAARIDMLEEELRKAKAEEQRIRRAESAFWRQFGGGSK